MTALVIYTKAEGNQMHVNVIITFTTKPEKQAAFKEMLNQVRRDLPTVEGCKGVEVFNGIHDPCVFTLVETWTSEAAHKQHLEKIVNAGLWSQVEAHLACDAQSTYYRPM
jgi:quinol monooxygenase YgiN